MERTFSMEYSAKKGERAGTRDKKTKHGDALAPPGSRRRRRGHLVVEHGSSAAGKVQNPRAAGKAQDPKAAGKAQDLREFKERRWAARRRDKMENHWVYGGDGGVQVKMNRSKAERLQVPSGNMRFFSTAPPCRAPPRRCYALAAEAVLTPRRRRAGADVLSQRMLALADSGGWPSGLDECGRLAAACLRKFGPGNRPASGPVLERWLRRHGCCSVRIDALMTPGALAEALLPLLDDSPAARRAVALFVRAGRGVDPKDPGPSPEDATAAALRARQYLRKVGEKVFCSWAWPQCARWLCSQSYVLVGVEASDVVSGLRRRGAVLDAGSDGRVVYDEGALGSIEAPRRRAEWCVLDLEKVARVAYCQRSKISLGWGLACHERAGSLRRAELGNLKARWLEAAVLQLDDKTPAVMSLRAKFSKAGNVVVLCSCVLGSEDSCVAEEACRALVQVVKADIAANHSPREMRMDGLAFRGEFGVLRLLESWLGCALELERDDSNYLTGGIWVTFASWSLATEAQVRDILRVTFSPEPAFRCPGALPVDEAAWLSAEPGYQRQLVSLITQISDTIVEAWQPESSAAGGEGGEMPALDLCGWPCPSTWCTYEGDFDGAVEWFKQEAVPRARESLLATWEERLNWFPEARYRCKFLLEEKQRERKAEQELEEACRSGKKVLIAGGSGGDGAGYPSGFPKRW